MTGVARSKSGFFRGSETLLCIRHTDAMRQSRERLRMSSISFTYVLGEKPFLFKAIGRTVRLRVAGGFSRYISLSWARQGLKRASNDRRRGEKAARQGRIFARVGRSAGFSLDRTRENHTQMLRRRTSSQKRATRIETTSVSESPRTSAARQLLLSR